MKSLFYGVWDGQIYDFRHGEPSAAGEVPALRGLEEFSPENPVKAFVADRGFLVFDAGVSLVDTFWQYMSRAAAESCGKCSPCRVGTAQLRDELQGMLEGKGKISELGRLRMLADQVSNTSLCGLGKSCCKALASALKAFRDVFEQEITAGQFRKQHGLVYTTAPCIEACPAKLDVPRYIDYIRNGKPSHAMGLILDKYTMAASCGRVCVRFCESACRRKGADGAVGIKMLKRFAADQTYNAEPVLLTRDLTKTSAMPKKRVAVVGAGPAGITCAYQLLRNGMDVDVLETQHKAGGMASVGIPSYRLPKELLKAETEDAIVRMGGRMLYGKTMGVDFTVDDLFAQGYDSVFLGYGASRGTMLGLTDEDTASQGYFSGIDFLKAVHERVEDGVPFEMNGEVVVVGAGNVAMDCVRSAVRLGASKVHLVYRRTVEDMPADHEEIEASEHEGVIFHCLTNPARQISENGKVVGIEVVQMRQAGVDSRGRNTVEAVPGSERIMRCDYLIAAIGQQVDRATLQDIDGVETDRWGCVKANPDTLETSRPGVFSGGDCVRGPATLIEALDQGARAANSITQHLMDGKIVVSPEQRMQNLLASNKLLANECLKQPLQKKERFTMPEMEVATRVTNFEEVEQVISQDEAYLEAERCLRCYRLYMVLTETPLATPHQYAATAENLG